CPRCAREFPHVSRAVLASQSAKTASRAECVPVLGNGRRGGAGRRSDQSRIRRIGRFPQASQTVRSASNSDSRQNNKSSSPARKPRGKGQPYFIGYWLSEGQTNMLVAQKSMRRIRRKRMETGRTVTSALGCCWPVP